MKDTTMFHEFMHTNLVALKADSDSLVQTHSKNLDLLSELDAKNGHIEMLNSSANKSIEVVNDLSRRNDLLMNVEYDLKRRIKSRNGLNLDYKIGILREINHILAS